MRKKLRTIKILLLVIIIIGGGFGYYYSHYIAPNNYTVKKTTINNSNLPKEFENFEIGFISDINLKNSSDITRLEKIITSLNKQHVDMVISVSYTHLNDWRYLMKYQHLFYKILPVSFFQIFLLELELTFYMAHTNPHKNQLIRFHLQ